MCIYALVYKTVKNYPLILAGNRDEFYERQTMPLHWWKEHPSVLGGIDLREGGSWLGVNHKGDYAVVTNYRSPSMIKEMPVSRGLLVKNFLTGNLSCHDYISEISQNDTLYNGYNLIIGNPGELRYYSNVTSHEQILEPGIYILSNHLLDTPWFKSLKVREEIQKLIGEAHYDNLQVVVDIFRDKTKAPDHLLPDTGMGYELEKLLSPVFVESAHYGTRSTSVLAIHQSGNVTMVERSYNPDGEVPVSFLINQ